MNSRFFTINMALALAATVFIIGCVTRPQINPDQAEAHYRIATSTLLKPGGAFNEINRREAFPQVEKAIAADPDNYRYHLLMGDLLRLDNILDQAEENYQKAVSLAPGQAEPLIGLGSLYFQQDRSQEAIKAYLRALSDRSYTSPERIYFNLGQAYFQEGDYPRAVESFQRVIELRPQIEVAHYQLGRTLMEMGLHEKAEIQFKKALELLPSSPASYFQLGLLYMKQRRLPEAKDAFSKVIELSTDEKLTDQAKRYLKILE